MGLDIVSYTDHLTLQTMASINTILEKADKKYKQLVNHKNELDLLLRCVSNEGGVSVSSSSSLSAAAGTTGVNKSIQVGIVQYVYVWDQLVVVASFKRSVSAVFKTCAALSTTIQNW